MGVAFDEAYGDYQKLVGGAPVARDTKEALLSGFSDGFMRGVSMHASVTIAALDTLVEQFKDPVTISSAREHVIALREAIRGGGA